MFLHRVRDLSNLFQYHLPGIQKEAEMHPLEYHPQEALTIPGAVDGREAAATNALLQNQPFVWLGQEGYWQWLARIWPQLPFGVKQMLKIGAAFGPSYAKNEYLTLLYIPENAKTLWERHSFRVINFGETETLQSAAAQRASIWPELPEKAGSEFINATLVELIDDLATSKLSYNDLESELKKGVYSQKVQQHVRSNWIFQIPQPNAPASKS
jgi:hypothetical protein